MLQALKERRKQLADSTGSARDGGPAPTLADAAVDIAQRALTDHGAPRPAHCGDAGARPRTKPTSSGASVEPDGGDAATVGLERTLFVHLIEQPPAEAAEAAEAAEGVEAESRAEAAKAAEEESRAEAGQVGPVDRGAGRFQAELDDGTPICGSTLRRLACDAGLVMAERSGEGSVLDVGRKRRTLTSALARALRMRDRTCRFPGCTHRAFLDAHHIEHWSCGGETRLGNLVRLCHFHHVAVHEGGFDVRRTEDGVAFFDADGNPLPPIARAVELDRTRSPIEQLAVDQSADGTRIDERTALPKCPGLSFHDIDIQGCVRALIRRAGQGAIGAEGVSAEMPSTPVETGR